MHPLPEHAHGTRQLLCLLLVLAILPNADPQPSAMWPEASVQATLLDLQLDELSGLVEADAPLTFWTHNDSGDAPLLFLIDARFKRLATHHIQGVKAHDVEDIARGPCAPDDPRACLYVGDFGDNRRVRPHVHIWQLLESAPDQPMAIWHLAYPDGPRNAEALVLDPRDATPYILDKDSEGRSKLWRVPRGGDDKHPATLIEVADLSRWLVDQPRVSGRLITAADLSPDQRCLAARTYLDVWTWCAPPGGHFLDALGSTPDRVRPPVMVQSEALAWDRAGDLWITGEHLLSPMLRLRHNAPGAK
jgi:hypothetical protein